MACLVCDTLSVNTAIRIVWLGHSVWFCVRMLWVCGIFCLVNYSVRIMWLVGVCYLMYDTESGLCDGVRTLVRCVTVCQDKVIVQSILSGLCSCVRIIWLYGVFCLVDSNLLWLVFCLCGSVSGYFDSEEYSTWCKTQYQDNMTVLTSLSAVC